MGDIHAIPVSHGEGRFVCTPEVLKTFAAGGQIATQYVDAHGKVSMDISANPNGSVGAVEGLISPDGRVLGKMGHTERKGRYVGINIVGDKLQPLFEGGAAYYL